MKQLLLGAVQVLGIGAALAVAIQCSNGSISSGPDAAACTASCDGRCGGPDGCDGTCPLTCSGGQGCLAPDYTQCGLCLPSCSGKCGGDDGCGSSCASTCGTGQTCQAPDYTQCTGCTASCAGKCGGPDGCSGTCPLTCTGSQGCIAPGYTQCGACTPVCTGKCGGPDSCGATCPNTCTGTQACQAPGYTQCACAPSCSGKCGGPNGCGATCPYTCATGQMCDPTTYACVTAKACTVDTDCGPPNLVCYKGYCDTGCTVSNFCNGDYSCNALTGWCKVALPTPAASDIYFIAFGDTRPANNGDPYPSVTGTIFGHVNSFKPHHVFIGGDYIETSTTYYTEFLTLQHSKYTWSGPVHYVVGNHEANTLSTYVSTMAAGLIGGKMYYSIVDTAQNAKYIVIADDAWDATQKTWLTNQFAVATKYTFVFRHHPSVLTAGSSSHLEGLPAVNPTATITSAQLEMVAMITAAKPTLVVVGHSHFYGMTKRTWTDTSGHAAEIIAGNGGAPLTADTAGYPPNYYGFVVLQQLPSGNIGVVSYESADENGNVKSPPVDVDWAVITP